MLAATPIADTHLENWPDGIDASLTFAVLLAMFSLPLLGYVAMVVDFRRYLRSLRRALVVVSQNIPAVPYWALLQRPACMRALGLEMPCTEAEVLAAYRERAKEMHPDRGGDLDQFLKLQQCFEQAMQLVQTYQEKQP